VYYTELFTVAAPVTSFIQNGLLQLHRLRLLYRIVCCSCTGYVYYTEGFTVAAPVSLLYRMVYCSYTGHVFNIELFTEATEVTDLPLHSLHTKPNTKFAAEQRMSKYTYACLHFTA